MPCEKPGPRASIMKKNLGLRPRFLSTESLGPCFSHSMGDHDQILHPIFQSTICCCQCPDSCAQERTSCGLPQSEHRLSPWCSLGLLAMVKGHVVELRQAGGHDIRHWSIGHIIYVTRQGDGHAHVQAGGGPCYVGGQLHQAYLKTEGDPVWVKGVIRGHHDGRMGEQVMKPSHWLI